MLLLLKLVDLLFVAGMGASQLLILLLQACDFFLAQPEQVLVPLKLQVALTLLLLLDLDLFLQELLLVF